MPIMFAAALVVAVGCNRPASESLENVLPTDSHPVPTAEQNAARIDEAATVKQLETAGWTRTAAKSVVELNASFFTVFRDEDPTAYENALARLRHLGQHPGLMDLLTRHPETAGLLAGAIDPVAVAAPLFDVRHYDTLTSLYLQHAAEPDALAMAFRDYKNVMIQLAKSGPAGSETVFLYSRGGNAAAEYGRWLEELLGRAVRRGNEDLEAALGVVLSQGPAIRRRMENDADFRHRFPDEIWPRFERLVDRGPLTWEQAAIDDHIFDLLALSDGEALITKWGLLPGYLLFGSNDYPKSLNPRIIAAMLNGDNDTLDALLRWGHLAQFRGLLERDGLSGKTLAAALKKLKQEREVNVPAKLAEFAGYSDLALTEEVGEPSSGLVTWLPLYDTFNLAKKVMQGRPVSATEWGFAIADPALMFLGPAKAGPKGTKILPTTLKNNARTQATKQLGQHAVKLSEKKLAPWLFSETLARLRQQTANSLQKKLTVEITDPVRYFFKATGMSRQTYRRLTTLEARLFMRADAKVYVRLDKLIGRPLVKKFFAKTSEAAFNRAVKDSRYEVELHTAWQLNASAWWLFNAVQRDE